MLEEVGLVTPAADFRSKSFWWILDKIRISFCRESCMSRTAVFTAISKHYFVNIWEVPSKQMAVNIVILASQDFWQHVKLPTSRICVCALLHFIQLLVTLVTLWVIIAVHHSQKLVPKPVPFNATKVYLEREKRKSSNCSFIGHPICTTLHLTCFLNPLTSSSYLTTIFLQTLFSHFSCDSLTSNSTTFLLLLSFSLLRACIIFLASWASLSRVSFISCRTACKKNRDKSWSPGVGKVTESYITETKPNEIFVLI